MFPKIFVKIRLFTFVLIVITIPYILKSQTKWTKYHLNPVIGDDLFHGICAVKPFVFQDKGILRMMHTTWDIYWKRSINEALSFDCIRWYQLCGSPLLSAGGINSFDENGLSKPCVIKNNNEYLMYYHAEDKYPSSIGVATSKDGLRWIKYSGNPVLASGRNGRWDDAGAMSPMVILKDSLTYFMYYQGYDGEYSNIGLAISSDGVHWEKYNDNPVIRHGIYNEFDELGCGEPSVIFAEGMYHMFYTGCDRVNINKIGYAYSQDGINWTKYSGNPVLVGGSSIWESQCVAAPSVIYKDSIFHMWYTGWGGGQATNIGYAISKIDTTLYEKRGLLNFNLSQNYPNPFNPLTQITFSIPEVSDVRLKIYDVLGREVVTLLDDKKGPGEYTLKWSADGYSSGIYFCRMSSGRFLQTRKMILVR